MNIATQFSNRKSLPTICGTVNQVMRWETSQMNYILVVKSARPSDDLCTFVVGRVIGQNRWPRLLPCWPARSRCCLYSNTVHTFVRCFLLWHAPFLHKYNNRRGVTTIIITTMIASIRSVESTRFLNPWPKKKLYHRLDGRLCVCVVSCGWKGKSGRDSDPTSWPATSFSFISFHILLSKLPRRTDR